MTNSIPQLLLKNVVGPDSSWFWTMVQGLVVAITLFLIYRQLLAQRLGNVLSSLGNFEERWNELEIRKARKALSTKYGSSDRSISEQDGLVLDFFERMGLYLRKGVFPPDIVWELYSYYIEHYWWISEPLIREYRLKTNDATWYSSFEFLYKKMQRQSKKRGIPCDGKTHDQITQFVKGENEKL